MNRKKRLKNSWKKKNKKNLMRKQIENKIKKTDIKLPQNGGIFSEKIIILFT